MRRAKPFREDRRTPHDLCHERSSPSRRGSPLTCLGRPDWLAIALDLTPNFISRLVAIKSLLDLGDLELAAGASSRLESDRAEPEIDGVLSALEDHRYSEAAELIGKLLSDGTRLARCIDPDIALLDAETDEAYEKFRGDRAGEEKEIEISPGVWMTFCWIPPGEFVMGSPVSEDGRGSDEDQVKVTISKGFWMAKTVVTNYQWYVVKGWKSCRFRGIFLPINEVRWNDAQEFLERLNARLGNADGGEMVLPTEAQWEYAARAGNSGPYSGGSIDEVAWYSSNSGSAMHAVATKKPNAWGLHDMSGNVWEWCADWYDYRLQGGVDPKGPPSGAHRVVRGGNWGYSAYYCRVAFRGNDDSPINSWNMKGFRVARILAP